MTHYRFKVATLLFVVVLSATFGRSLSVSERLPDGTYCGEYSNGAVQGRLRTKKGADTFDLFLIAFGDRVTCKNEKYIYDPNTHTAVVPGATDPNDCLGRVLLDNDLTLAVSYDPQKDVMTLVLEAIVIECKKC